MTLTLTAYDAASPSYALITGAAADPWKLVTANWGNAVWDVLYSGPRGTLGARPTSSTVQNRQVALGLRLLPASVMAGAGHQSDLNEIVDLMRRYGGRLTVRHDSQTYRQHLEVLAGTAALGDWTNRAEWRGRVDYALTFVAEPYVRGDPMEVDDGFDTDTRANYTYDSGASSQHTVSGGEVSSSTTSTIFRVFHSLYGYSYGDVHASVTGTVGSSLTNFRLGVRLKRTAADSGLDAHVLDDGTNSILYIVGRQAGAQTTLAQTTLTRLTAGQRIRVSAYIVGNTVVAQYWNGAASEEIYASTPTSTTSVVLSSADAALYGRNVTAPSGYVWAAAASDARLDRFTVYPYTYLSRSMPEVLTMHGAIPGDAPAACDVEVYGSGMFAMLAWSRRPQGENWAAHGDLDDYPNSVSSDPTDPWSNAAVSGVTGAATSKAVARPGYRSRNALQVVAPATANTGASLRIGRRFRAGVSYTASAYLRAASGTTNARIRLGISGDIASSTAVALSTTWTLHTLTWTPTADRDLAWFAAEITAATATTFQVDQVMVYETDQAAAALAIPSGRGGRAALAVLEAADGSSRVPGGSASLTYTTGLGAGYRYGDALRQTNSTAGIRVYWPLDPDLLDPDPHATATDIEIWARVVTPAWGSANGAIIGFVSSPPDASGNANLIYTREYGASGRTLPFSQTLLTRVGTVSVPHQRGIGAAARLLVGVQIAAPTLAGNVDIDYLMVVPARSRALSPTGKSATGYPEFIYNLGLKRATADLRGYLYREAAVGFSPSTGLGGSLIELDPGINQFLATLRPIPDRTDANPADTATATMGVRFIPTPRWHQLRDA